MASYAKLMARAGHPLNIGAVTERPRLRDHEPLRRVRQDHTVWALLHMPAVRCIRDDEAVTRLLALHRWDDRDLAQEMADNFMQMQPDCLTTFFPLHP